MKGPGPCRRPRAGMQPGLRKELKPGTNRTPYFSSVCASSFFSLKTCCLHSSGLVAKNNAPTHLWVCLSAETDSAFSSKCLGQRIQLANLSQVATAEPINQGQGHRIMQFKHGYQEPIPIGEGGLCPCVYRDHSYVLTSDI